MFSGIGGFELGIQRAYNNKQFTEIEQNRKRGNRNTDEQPILLCTSKKPPLCVGYSEIDKYSIQTYEKNFKGHKNYGNAKNIEPNKLPDFDMLCGGFPCQAFSIAGKRRGFEDTRGTLFFDIARILKVKRPKIVFLENVKGLLNHNKGETFSLIIQTLEELGYETQWMVLNSKFFGVPQNRERVFIIGNIRGTSRPKILPIGEVNAKDIITNRVIGEVKVRKYPVNVPKLKQVLRANRKSISQISEELDVKKTTVEHWFRKDSCFSIPDAEVWFKLKELLGITTDEFDQSITEFEIRDNKYDQGNRVYSEDGISPTITTLTGGHQHVPIETKYQIRRLTPIECERLQGFPDNWTKGVSDTQRYKQLGNAVTVNVIEAIIQRFA